MTNDNTPKNNGESGGLRKVLVNGDAMVEFKDYEALKAENEKLREDNERLNDRISRLIDFIADDPNFGVRKERDELREQVESLSMEMLKWSQTAREERQKSAKLVETLQSIDYLSTCSACLRNTSVVGEALREHEGSGES